MLYIYSINVLLLWIATPTLRLSKQSSIYYLFPTQNGGVVVLYWDLQYLPYIYPMSSDRCFKNLTICRWYVSYNVYHVYSICDLLVPVVVDFKGKYIYLFYREVISLYLFYVCTRLMLLLNLYSYDHRIWLSYTVLGFTKSRVELKQISMMISLLFALSFHVQYRMSCQCNIADTGKST